MRFARHSTIFRGPMDPAPLAGVLFLLVIFLLLSSLLYTPGVLVKIGKRGVVNTQAITITGANRIIFAGKTNDAAHLEQLRADLKDSAIPPPFTLRVLPGADPRLVEKVQDLFQIQLPDGDNLAGTDNPTVIVAVNFRGQCFFENKPVQDQELKEDLRARLQETSRASKQLTMVLWADKAVENDVVMRLYRLARDAGVTEFLLAGRPNVFGATSGRLPP
jgi:biopolymer transport protein ExbD